jgi:L-lysine exporter family protein LysE/ArgO
MLAALANATEGKFWPARMELRAYAIYRRKMVFVSYVHVLSAAFLMGLAAAAPMGPVNMLAIRRGMIGGWRHTLACGVGSVAGDLILFSLVLLGGHYLFSDLSNPTLKAVLASTGVIVLLPLGIYFLVRAVKEPLRPYSSARQHRDESTVPAHLFVEIADGFALTIFNPLTILYWVGVSSNWLPFAHSVLGYSAPGWGILMATAGLLTWFAALIVFVRFIPHRIGPSFFRLVNALLGLMLLGFGAFCATVLFHQFLR